MSARTARYGRKYGLTWLGLVLGAVVCVLGMVGCVLARDVAPPLAEITLAYAGIVSLTISAFSGAAAYEGRNTTTRRKLEETTIQEPQP